MGESVVTVNLSTMLQTITPDRLLGRVFATMRSLVSAGALAGSLAGGYLGGFIGLRSTILVAACAHLVVLLWIVASPVRSVHELAVAAEAPAMQ
jgi:MFS family permease